MYNIFTYDSAVKTFFVCQGNVSVNSFHRRYHTFKPHYSHRKPKKYIEMKSKIIYYYGEEAFKYDPIS